MTLSNLGVAICLIFSLSACGGGGGGSKNLSQTSQPDNNAPIVSISGATEVDANNNLSLTANASDADGSIATYAWVVDSGSAITLTDSTKAQVSFIAPKVDKDTVVSLTVTVTDNKGATAKDIKQITIKSKKISLTITGLVIDGGAIPNADLNIAVGDLSFKTKANASGKYTIAIDVDDAHLMVPVVITALGDATQPTIKLVSQLNSVNKLLTQAGTDKILEATENIGVNVSNVTTAEFVLLAKPSSWGMENIAIANDEQLQQALEAIGSYKKMRLAAFLQIVASDSRFKLPDGSKTTLDFVQNETAVDAFEVMLYQKDSTVIDKTKTVIYQDGNLVMNSNLAGKYIAYSESNAKFYMLTFNTDASGELTSSQVTSPQFTSAFTWVKQGSSVMLTFPVPIETGKTDFYGGRWVIKTAELNIYDEYPSSTRAVFRLNSILIEKDGQETFPEYEQNYVNLFNISKSIAPDATTLAGEWVAGNTYDAVNFQFSTDHSLVIKTYRSPEETTNSIWSTDSYKISFKAKDDTNEDIYLINNLGVGYTYVKITRSQNSLLGVSSGLFIKVQKDLAFKKSDLVGFWADNTYSIRVMASDGTMFTDFGYWFTTWTNNESDNSWTRKFYTIDRIDWLTSCNSGAGTNVNCKIYKDYTSKIIANKANTYYSLGSEADYSNGTETPYMRYSLTQAVKLSVLKYFAPWIIDGVPKSYYQQTSDGVKVWNFYENKFFIDNKVLTRSLFNVNEIPFSLKNNNLHYVRNSIARELQLVSASENGLMVCEFNEGSSCVTGTEFLLSNRSPAKISLSVVGSGTLLSSWSSDSASFPDLLYGNKAAFDVRPDANMLVKSVTGCGGSLSGGRYITAEVRDACTITATFGPAQ